MTDELESGAPSPDPPSANLYGSHGSATGPNSVVININGVSEQLFGMSHDELLVKFVLTQENLVDELREGKESQRLIAEQKREIERLQDQLGKVRGLVPSLVDLYRSLGHDKIEKESRRAALRVQFDQALDDRDSLKAELDRLDSYLKAIEVQRVDVLRVVRETDVEQQIGQNILDVFLMRLQVLTGMRIGSEQRVREVTTAAFSMSGRSADGEDLIAYAGRILAEAAEILEEAHKLMKELALELYRAVAPGEKSEEQLARVRQLEGEIATIRRRHEAFQEKVKAQELKHERELSKRERELAKQKRGTPDPVRVLREGTSGLLPGLGLFLLGVVIREVSKLAPLSQTQQWVFVTLALLFAVAPIAVLLKWSASADSSAQIAVAALGAFCVVAGNFSWLVAAVFGLVALASVVSTRKFGPGFALALIGALVVSAALPGVMWWSWSGFDWLARVL
ncbi:hypothetical protein [Lentzea sp. NBRC 102530]|uniref:hypothetical protein n=1 Tax=Lentzea sp. NBRC 102530 TaxID=3032201 RepID=UPI0024A51493|nr:hypothetical protein [Lentzea sp. NBRC 102530]GLY46609.1 hypothetical protein Lesp01_02650 [Lentzea sp. NBRC 102530]